MARWRKWSPDRDAALVTLWREGLPVSEIAHVMGASASSVGRRVERIRRNAPERLPYRAHGEWSAEEVRLMHDMVMTGGAIADIAARLRRSEPAVRTMMSRMCIPGAVMPRWSEDERASLRAWIADGVSHAEIAARLGRSRQAVKYKIWSMRHRGEGA